MKGLLRYNSFAWIFFFSDTIDSVKQSAGLTLLRLLRASPDMIPIGEWTSRIIHLLNDQHMVSICVFLAVLQISQYLNKKLKHFIL